MFQAISLGWSHILAKSKEGDICLLTFFLSLGKASVYSGPTLLRFWV